MLVPNTKSGAIFKIAFYRKQLSILLSVKSNLKNAGPDQGSTPLLSCHRRRKRFREQDSAVAVWDAVCSRLKPRDTCESGWSLYLHKKEICDPFVGIYCSDIIIYSKDVLVEDLISLRGDIHHLFPKDYLKKSGLGRGEYNQIANYVYMQSEINIKVGNKAPKDYFHVILDQIKNDQRELSGLRTEPELIANLDMNCVPTNILSMGVEDYSEFLNNRRMLMAQKIKAFYFGL